MWLPAWAKEFAVTFAPCSCSLLSGEGLSWEGPSHPGGPRHSAVSGVRQSSASFLLVQRGRPTHLQQCWQTQTRYITCFQLMCRQGKTCVYDPYWPICACRSWAVLPQRSAEWRRRLRLYLPWPAQHQQEPGWDRRDKCVSSYGRNNAAH